MSLESRQGILSGLTWQERIEWFFHGCLLVCFPDCIDAERLFSFCSQRRILYVYICVHPCSCPLSTSSRIFLLGAHGPVRFMSFFIPKLSCWIRAARRLTRYAAKYSRESAFFYATSPSSCRHRLFLVGRIRILLNPCSFKISRSSTQDSLLWKVLGGSCLQAQTPLLIDQIYIVNVTERRFGRIKLFQMTRPYGCFEKCTALLTWQQWLTWPASL